jgi:methyltransferase-like protein/SAM-dependent methyltransferase
VKPPPTSYDRVPYPSLAFSETHPDRLATVARIFGLRTPDVAECRVLELGCASGGNLIPMAFNLPGSEFVGVDLSRHQVDDGLATVRALNLTNIRIEHASILDIDSGWGQFDYIICHGVFSWVEPPIQDKILEIARGNLTPDGIAYVSYNTYPGWHLREMVRHMMRYHAGQFDEPGEEIEQARALLDFLASAAAGSGPYGELLTREVERLKQASDSYLYHEHLESTNAPMYFHQFMERAEAAGLQYLSEASVTEMLTSHFPAEVAETLERISPDILHVEQYMDFVRNRQFRQTLLCQSGLKPKRALTPAFLSGLMVSSRALPEKTPIDMTTGASVAFAGGGRRGEVTLPATKAAFSILMETWPRATAVERLCEAALERAAPFLGNPTAEEARRSLLSDLFGAVMYGLVGLHTHPPSCTNHLSERPRVHGLVAYQATRGNVVVNAHHNAVGFEPFSLEVLKLANGERRPQDMLDILLARHAQGELTIEENGAPVTTPDAARLFLEDRVEKVLASLTRNAVLVG